MKRFADVISRILLSIPLAIGWLAGFIVRCVRLTWAAVIEGYHAGNNL